MTRRRFLFFVGQHLSLLIMVLGAGSIYVASVALKSMLSQQDYGYFGLLVTYIGVLYGFGLFGIEQVMLRTARILHSGSIMLSKRVFLYLVISLLLGSFLGSLLLVNWIPSISFPTGFVLSMGVVLTMLMYNVFRLRSKFIVAQIVVNLWKISLFAVFICDYILGWGYVTLNEIVLIVTMVFGVFPICLVVYLYRSKIVTLGMPEQEEWPLIVAYLISLAVITLLNNIDRLSVEYLFTPAVFGDYYYRVVLVVMPLNLLSGYIGFKNLVHYKTRFTIFLLKVDIVRTLLLFIVLSILVLAAIELGWHMGIVDLNINQELTLVVPLILLGMSRGVNSVVSSAVGAMGSAREIFSANLMTILVLVMGFMLVSFYSDDHLIYTDIKSIVWLTFIIWLFRIAFMYRCVLASRTNIKLA